MGEGALCFAVGSAKKPGEWKDQVNQAGATVFVLPELVPGTLREAFERIQALADPRGTRADDDVRRERSASLHGRQRPNRATGDELRTQQRGLEPHHLAHCLPLGLTASVQGAEQPRRRSACLVRLREHLLNDQCRTTVGRVAQRFHGAFCCI